MITKHERLNALENQISRLQRRLVNLNRRGDRYSWIRLAIFLVGALLSVVAFFLVKWMPTTDWSFSSLPSGWSRTRSAPGSMVRGSPTSAQRDLPVGSRRGVAFRWAGTG